MISIWFLTCIMYIIYQTTGLRLHRGNWILISSTLGRLNRGIGYFWCQCVYSSLHNDRSVAKISRMWLSVSADRLPRLQVGGWRRLRKWRRTSSHATVSGIAMLSMLAGRRGLWRCLLSELILSDLYTVVLQNMALLSEEQLVRCATRSVALNNCHI